MRTRRSPRNQERLWRALGGPAETKPKRTRLLSRAEARAKLFAKESQMYSPNWPKCPVCGEPALDGHITCGKAACNEAEQRVRFQHGMITKEEVEEVLKKLEK